MKIKIINKNNINFVENYKIEKIIKNFIKTEIEINVMIVEKNLIKNINKRYKKKNKTTDILTFKNKVKNTTIDIVLCPDIIKKKHNENWKKILIHGLLHIIKYEHDKIKENKIMEKTQETIGMSGIEPPTITTSK